MKKSVIMQLVVVLLIGIMVVTGCGNSKEGGLPTLKVGDKWVSRTTSGDTEYTMTIEVTGEDIVNGKDCYVMKGSFEPLVMDIMDVMTAKMDKATMLPVMGQMSGEYMDAPFIVTFSDSYESLEGAQPYPLEIGKEYKIIETETTTTTSMGETTTDTAENTYIYKIETIEEITVPAGTFRCFKIIQYDETGTTAIKTSWQSDETKQYDVKSIDSETGDTTELISYSVQ